MNTVIRAPNWIGDGIMSLPAIRAFRKFFPDARLTLCVKSYLADLFQHVAEIDEIASIPDRWNAASYLRQLGRFREKRFDNGILFTNSFSSALFFRLAGIRRLSGYARDGRGWLLTGQVPPGDDRPHHQFHYLRIVEHLAGRKTTGPFSAALVLTAQERSQAEILRSELGIEAGRELLAIAPAAAYGGAKTWLPERFQAVIRSWLRNHADSEVLLLGSQGEREKVSAVAAGLPGGVHNLAGRLSLRQTIILLASCRLLICNDSGLMHIASSLGVPLLAIFGPTEHQKTSPLAGANRLLYHGADCAPCLHRDCPTDHRCMTAVSCEEVLAAAEALWNQPMAGSD